MPVSYQGKKLYLPAPGLEFRVNGPIKIGNVITNMSLPQDPITFLSPLSDTIEVEELDAGTTENRSRASVNAGLAAKFSNVFDGQAEAQSSSSLRTVYDFDKISALYLEKNPTGADAKAFRLKDEEFRNALKTGPVYIVTGLKIAKGLKYSDQKADERSASLRAGAHVTQEAAIEGSVGGATGTENSDAWKLLGEPIIAYRLHVVKGKWWSRGQGNLTSSTYVPDAGLMSKEDEVDDFESQCEELSAEDVGNFAKKQYFQGLDYVDIEDGVEEWTLACLQE